MDTFWGLQVLEIFISFSFQQQYEKCILLFLKRRIRVSDIIKKTTSGSKVEESQYEPDLSLSLSFETGSLYIAKAGPKHKVILLTKPLKCSNYRYLTITSGCIFSLKGIQI